MDSKYNNLFNKIQIKKKDYNELGGMINDLHHANNRVFNIREE